MGTPFILTAFANDPKNLLANLQNESDVISDALRAKKDSGIIDLEVQQGATIPRLFDLITRYSQDLVLLHYGGHADGTALDLQAIDGTNVQAQGKGLAQLLGTLPNLKLVVLNGCATQGHVEQLLAQGVPAVIATQAPINDATALEFTRQFYKALADPMASRTIDAAFTIAAGLVGTTPDNAITFETRGTSFGDPEPPAVGLDKWGLYATEGKEVAFAWKLPTSSARPFVIAAAPANTATAISTPNNNLLVRLAGAVGEFDSFFKEDMEIARRRSRTGAIDEREVRVGVIDAYPAPIGKKLQALFAGGQMGDPRLPLLVETYDIATRLITFALLAQLWDLFEEKPGAVNLDEGQWGAIEQFNALDEPGAATFDYLAFAVTLVSALNANGAVPYMQECAGLGAAFAQSEGAAAQSFMNETRAALQAGSINPAKVGELEQAADHHLEVAMIAMTFVVGYKLATIKEISIERTRRKKASFLHKRVVLDKANAAYLDDTGAFADYADNESVILLKDLDDVRSYINLSPFVIDRNALTRNTGSNVYFLRFYDGARDISHYAQISEGSDKLELLGVMLPVLDKDNKEQPNPLEVSGPAMLKLYQEFRSTVAKR